MSIKNTIKSGLVGLVLTASTNANADDARRATPEQIQVPVWTNSQASMQTTVNSDDKNDWGMQYKLIEGGAIVLIEPVRGQPGSCFYGLDGFPQKYNFPADVRTSDLKLERSEMIVNLSETNPERQFYFPCNILPTPETPNTVYVPGPVVEKEVPAGDVSVGVGYVMIKTPAEELYNFDGFLHGGKAWVHFQPKNARWYFGPEVMFYGNEGSATKGLEVPAVDGPLAGQLVMKGTNDYSLSLMGIGAGFTGGIMVANGEKFRFGLELQSGFMHDWMTRELTERSAHYINGMIVEGTDISNTTADAESNFNIYNAIALHPEFYGVGLTLGAGARTNFVGTPQPMVNAGISYRF